MKKIIHFAMVLLASATMLSCKKNSPSNDNSADGPSKNGTELDLIRDSVFLYAKEAYYWNDALPNYGTFKPRSFTGSNDLDALTKEVDAISQYNEFDKTPNGAKYSFIDKGETSTELGGTQGDFGFAPFYNVYDSGDLRIRYVYPGSPAAIAGIKRGDRVISINGNSNVAYDNGGAVTQFVVNAFFYSNNIALVLERNGSRFSVNIAAGQYTTNPVLTYKIFEGSSGRKTGYFVFNVFTSDENATPRLNEIFSYFAANGVTDLVVDLRYNGGGYVSTAEYLCNLMVPLANNSSVMYKTYYNNTITTGNAKLLANQVRRDPETGEVYNYAQLLNFLAKNNTTMFEKKGALNSVGKICFIVGGGTASASELVINNMKGVNGIDVKLIGSKTYGKPVGFFDIRINKYEMYIPEFETKNALYQGGYFTGMVPGSAQYLGQLGNDDVTHDFGDTRETLLSYALNYINSGKYTTTGSQLQVQSTQQKPMLSVEQVSTLNAKLDNGKFSGMIYDKPLKRN
ncbi:S41 family peptidase [Mucilaginibacter auburnensis]|uniref:Peptidase S41-like protein n=1 Tax=Mucilaginibacter auburnensis TaxID=1457233 RepID=A0A2H9VLD7_9SPHI|nr:S41 family peptidase [Mucilaginibacter auburnensis]PJJ79157.1 peptidase S41-like protein [Mucilaginibacter auburnensis]